MISELMRKCVDENASSILDQTEYSGRYGSLVMRYEYAKARLAENNGKLEDRRAKYEKIREFIKALRKQDDLLTEFDEGLFDITVDRIIIRSDKETVFVWNDCAETSWTIE